MSVKSQNDKVTIRRDDAFPYLDMELYWREDALKFRVHLKDNQILKYLNLGSTHTQATFKSIPHGVIRRLTILTSPTPENEDLPINEIYPLHTAALERAELPVPKQYPTLKESLKQINARSEPSANQTAAEEAKARHKRERDRKRSVYFCVGYSDTWATPISK